MKILLTALASLLFVDYYASAQNTPITIQRTVTVQFITKDSVAIPFDDDFEITETVCSALTRYAHLKLPERKFFGPFRDVSRLDSNVVLTQGNYTADGLKDGPFITRYLNGKLQAKGNFKNNNFDGHWEMYYEDGRPKLTFDATGDGVIIGDAWDEKGVKIVENGTGDYFSEKKGLYWGGKLLNGKYDGTWRAYKTDDASKTEMFTITYKNGSFVKGKLRSRDLSSDPEISLIGPDNLPFIHAEMLHVATGACGGPRNKQATNVQNARYVGGMDDFMQNISDVIAPYFKTVDLKQYRDFEFDIEGEIDERGVFSKFVPHSDYGEDIAHGIVLRLHRLLAIQPATVDGKPVVQKFVMHFKIVNGMYRFTYRLLPVEVS